MQSLIFCKSASWKDFFLNCFGSTSTFVECTRAGRRCRGGRWQGPHGTEALHLERWRRTHNTLGIFLQEYICSGLSFALYAESLSLIAKRNCWSMVRFNMNTTGVATYTGPGVVKASKGKLGAQPWTPEAFEPGPALSTSGKPRAQRQRCLMNITNKGGTCDIDDGIDSMHGDSW